MSSETKHLVLLRHAQADHGALRDVDRALSLDGRTHARIVGQQLAEAGLLPDLVLCSAAVRTRQTWQLAESGMAELGEGVEVRYLDELYQADVGDVLEAVRAVPETTGTVLVVGHEPVTSAVAHLLAGPGSQESAVHRVRTGVSTSMAVVLDHTAPWAALERRGCVLTSLISGRRDG
ncbi:histidine phosphatase family protein [Ruania suaedae]|uniref:SixA phosphatase family protein n=1 Tax=Ruania suaedae TaxID=2897774 RepID=UPI001E4C379A|nr:histidine phosphatase family protein [Ruania suaedae]UFU04323.1 histidine phosphatase family protein [Ruania suaedae]